MPDLRWWPPSRRVLLWLSNSLRWWPRAEAMLLDYLYPSDATLYFGGDNDR